MKEFARRILVLVPLALACTACAEDSSSAGPMVVTRADGCTLVVATNESSVCRVHWDCSELGPRILTCATSGAETLCQCSEGEEETPPDPVVVAEGCGEPPYEAAALRICGWKLL